MTKTLILSQAAFLACCIDDVAEVLHKGQSQAARSRRQVLTQFAWFTSTKVPILLHKGQSQGARSQRQVLGLLALLVQKCKY
jgi:hypothetical protein